MIAEILFEVAWKSMVVAAGVVALLYGMQRQTASNRVAVGGLGFLLLLALPAVVLMVARLPLPVIEMASPSPAIGALPLALPETAMAALPSSPVDPNSQAFASRAIWMFLWVAGALSILLRLAAGLLTLRSWTRRAEQFLAARKWQDMLRSCGVGESARIYVSNEISAPLSWGWRRPTILIDRETLANPSEAEAVIAHEAAHLARGDWPRLIAARLVVALFWFNPFVWLLERLYLQDVEEAADAQATRLVEPAHYAQALLNVARNAAVPVGANSIASGSLARRIRRVLSGRVRSRWDSTWRVGALASVAMFAGPIAIVQFVAPAVSVAAPAAPAAPEASPAPLPEVRAAPSPLPAPAPVALARTPTAPTAAATPPAVAPRAPVAPMAVAVAVAQTAQVAPRAEPVSREEVERIRRATDGIRAQSVVIARDSQAIAQRARAEAASAMANARQNMLRGADEMERGALEMRRGAAQMRDEAHKLRDPAYRAKVIAEAEANKARGSSGKWGNKVPTDQELIDAIPRMEDGARRMDEGVERMREGAAKMRRSAQGN
jgi:beta-lactamase regulating signal transducer with metallopeptidase domain